MLQFTSERLRGADFKILCNELLALEDLRIRVIKVESTNDLANFYKLEKLRKCNLIALNFPNDLISSALDRLSHKSLTELHLVICGFTVTASKVQLLGSNFPQLKKICLSAKSSLKILNSMIKYFPNLEELELYASGISDDYVFQEGITNDKLKTFKCNLRGNSRNSEELLKLFSCIKNLETISFHGFHFSEELVNKLIQALEDNWPNLKKFSCSCENCIYGIVYSPFIRAITFAR